MPNLIRLLLIAIAWGIVWLYAPLLLTRAMRMQHVPYVGLGALAYAVAYAFWLRKHSQFWQTLDHELSHALWSLLSFKPIRELNVHHQGNGRVTHEGEHNLLICLAPYFFRLPVWIAVIFVCVIQQKPLLFVAQFTLGIAMAYALLAIIEEARPHQPDLKVYGLLCSYSWIIACNILAWGVAFALTTGGGKTAVFFLKQGLSRAF